jgi:hypothetical protein
VRRCSMAALLPRKSLNVLGSGGRELVLLSAPWGSKIRLSLIVINCVGVAIRLEGIETAVSACELCFGPLRFSCPLLYLIFAEHRPPALFRATAAVGIVFVAVEEVVLVGQLFVGRDVPNCPDKHPSVDAFRLAVGIARVIDEHGNTKAIDHRSIVGTAEEIRDVPARIAFIRMLFREARTVVFTYFLSLPDRP